MYMKTNILHTNLFIAEIYIHNLDFRKAICTSHDCKFTEIIYKNASSMNSSNTHLVVAGFQSSGCKSFICLNNIYMVLTLFIILFRYLLVSVSFYLYFFGKIPKILPLLQSLRPFSQFIKKITNLIPLFFSIGQIKSPPSASMLNLVDVA